MNPVSDRSLDGLRRALATRSLSDIAFDVVAPAITPFNPLGIDPNPWRFVGTPHAHVIADALKARRAALVETTGKLDELISRVSRDRFAPEHGFTEHHKRIGSEFEEMATMLDPVYVPPSVLTDNWSQGKYASVLPKVRAIRAMLGEHTDEPIDWTETGRFDVKTEMTGRAIVVGGSAPPRLPESVPAFVFSRSKRRLFGRAIRNLQEAINEYGPVTTPEEYEDYRSRFRLTDQGGLRYVFVGGRIEAATRITELYRYLKEALEPHGVRFTLMRDDFRSDDPLDRMKVNVHVQTVVDGNRLDESVEIQAMHLADAVWSRLDPERDHARHERWRLDHYKVFDSENRALKVRDYTPEQRSRNRFYTHVFGLRRFAGR
jgi:hypothetical protein